MVRRFSFKWYKNEKYREPMERINSITVVDAPEDTGLAAKTAVNLFEENFGSLRYNTIISIQEYNDEGFIGEPIVPDTENTILPTKR